MYNWLIPPAEKRAKKIILLKDHQFKNTRIINRIAYLILMIIYECGPIFCESFLIKIFAPEINQFNSRVGNN
jgi:hypothetical protein